MGTSGRLPIAGVVVDADPGDAMRLSDLMHEDGYPRAPTREVWARLSPEEREQVVAILPGEVTDAEQSMPEGDRHFRPKIRALDALRGHFQRLGRQFYIASELPIYYPGSRRFAPDLMVVFDVDDHERDKYVVAHEGRGLDWVMEVHVGGDRKKDAEFNVARYAELGISEYFIFDGGRLELLGFRLPPGGGAYQPIPMREGRMVSQVLNLELKVEGGSVRFLHGDEVVLESSELIQRLQGDVNALRTRVEEERARADDERARRQELERENARLRGER